MNPAESLYDISMNSAESLYDISMNPAESLYDIAMNPAESMLIKGVIHFRWRLQAKNPPLMLQTSTLIWSPEYYLKLMQHKLEAKLQIFTVFILRN